MMRFLFPLLAATWVVPVAAAETPSHRLTQLEPIELKAGGNLVQHFTLDDDGPANILLGYRGNGNAHSYNVYLVLTRGNGVTGFEKQDKSLDDTITDAPHTGEDIVRSVRFAHGEVDGVPATLTFVAHRDIDPEGGIPAASFVDFTVYRLTRDGEDPPDYFKPIMTTRSNKKYCNADMALRTQFGLALPSNYQGSQTADGCF